MWCLSSSVPVKDMLSNIVEWMKVSAVSAVVVVGHVSSSKCCHCQVQSSRKCVIRRVLSSVKWCSAVVAIFQPCQADLQVLLMSSKPSSSRVAWVDKCGHMLLLINCCDVSAVQEERVQKDAMKKDVIANPLKLGRVWPCVSPRDNSSIFGTFDNDV